MAASLSDPDARGQVDPGHAHRAGVPAASICDGRGARHGPVGVSAAPHLRMLPGWCYQQVVGQVAGRKLEAQGGVVERHAAEVVHLAVGMGPDPAGVQPIDPVAAHVEPAGALGAQTYLWPANA